MQANKNETTKTEYQVELSHAQRKIKLLGNRIGEVEVELSDRDSNLAVINEAFKQEKEKNVQLEKENERLHKRVKALEAAEENKGEGSAE